ncbi:regulator of G protein signaling domain-containing protein [Sporodiniella umbellata]|nr:regulator of G protein signaling domain-containing protein [Sporodiniella umbellata]
MESNVSQQAYTSMMRFNIDGRPFLNDIHDLFAALIVQIPLDTHRYLFRNYYSTFSSEDAIQVLGNLRFSHTVSVFDPNDPDRLQKTTTTTTFNMAREMAKTLCQQFQNCRLMENAIDPQNKAFRDKSIWHLTPKGLCILQDFCVRTEVNVTTLRKHFSHMEAIQLARLERNTDDDQLVLNRACTSAIFRVMMASLPLDGELSNTGNVSTSSVSRMHSSPSISSTSSDSSANSSSLPSLSAPFAMSSSVAGGETRVQLLGNYLLTLSKTNNKNLPKNLKTMRTIFSSQMCCDWLLDYCMTSCREEAEMVIGEFLKYGWIEYQDSKYNHKDTPLKTSKTIMFAVTEKGRQTIADISKPQVTVAIPQLAVTANTPKIQVDDQTTLREILKQDPDSLKITQTTTTHEEEKKRDEVAETDPKESTSSKLHIILECPKLRSPFKEFLRANFCEENLDFWIDYTALRRRCRNQSPALPSHNQRDLLEDAYDIWSTYLAPGSSCELNVEHSLCQEMARIVNSIVTVIPAYPGPGKPTILITTSSASQSLRLMLKLFDRVNEHICRLMASDSVPKFIKTDKYQRIVESLERAERKKQREDALQNSLVSDPVKPHT